MSNATDEFRAWLGVPVTATDDQLRGLLELAQAKREALGYGSVFLMAARMLRQGYAGPPKRKGDPAGDLGEPQPTEDA